MPGDFLGQQQGTILAEVIKKIVRSFKSKENIHLESPVFTSKYVVAC